MLHTNLVQIDPVIFENKMLTHDGRKALGNLKSCTILGVSYDEQRI